MDESHKQGWTKDATDKKHILCNFIYIKFKKDKATLVLKVRVMNLKRSKITDRKRNTRWGLLGYLEHYFLTWVMGT